MVFSLKTLLCIGCGCFVGGVLRYLTALYIGNKLGINPAEMPWHTLIINFGGCLLMGVFYALGANGFIESPNMRAALMTGLCGGYSTLSAFAYENTFILKAGSYFTATAYISATIIGSIICFILGYVVANSLSRA